MGIQTGKVPGSITLDSGDTRRCRFDSCPINYRRIPEIIRTIHLHHR